ncbi:dicarboxylate/amino acid:cation symporter [Luteithermobacter gelatinilyticus]|uniref:dicarboxylate/amino acid:cation symporter n=1 Tax=Luteithermobacter gelatinilyticus TaxID=2582913 RepID=UPI001106ACF3|nr:dicarboxylate/amino acid:cation symporter [Luteithermobacter gelatinilyticus]|tara:strand:- start:11774 stop:13015 length:1242 start_codon:yes stop_codon:yes gene_type:complete
MKFWTTIKLWKRIVAALILGIAAGLLLGEHAESIKWMGDLFIRLVRMLIVPMIFITLVSGVIGMGDPAKMGSIGIKTIVTYMVTTLLAISIGLMLGTVFEPGSGVDLSGAAPKTLSESMPLGERMMTIVPVNPVEVLASGDILPIIFFAIFLGICIVLVGDKGKPLAKIFDSGTEAILKMTHLIMEVAPIGVFALIAYVIGTKGIDTLTNILTLTLVVYGGCLLHMAVVYGGIVRFLLKLPLKRFFPGILDAQLVAYSTSMSSATLPVSISVAEDNLGIKPAVASSVLPMGATINMDGTALYVGIVTLFAAQAFGIDLALVDYVVIALTTTLVSIGTAAVPSASLFLIAAVMGSIGITDAQTAIIVGFILPFDRFLDMMRTMVNVTGDLTVATAVAKWEGELDEKTFRASPVE